MSKRCLASSHGLMFLHWLDLRISVLDRAYQEIEEGRLSARLGQAEVVGNR